MNIKWKALNSIEQLDAIISESNQKSSVIFKHSTRCSISTMALNRLEKLENAFYDKANFYYLDLMIMFPSIILSEIIMLIILIKKLLKNFYLIQKIQI